MPNIAKVLREEIARISKREAKSISAPIRKATAKLRPDVADLKNRMAVMEKEVKRLNLLVVNLVAAQPAPAEVPEEGRAWISGKGVKTLRRKTGLSQKEFATLTGVSPRAVTLWESKPGMLKLRDEPKAALMAVRGIGKAEARKRLEAMIKPAKKVRKVARRGKARKLADPRH